MTIEHLLMFSEFLAGVHSFARYLVFLDIGMVNYINGTVLC